MCAGQMERSRNISFLPFSYSMCNQLFFLFVHKDATCAKGAAKKVRDARNSVRPFQYLKFESGYVSLAVSFHG
jgi:hypothetical protein